MELRRKIGNIMQKLNFSELEIAFYMEVLKKPQSSIYEISRRLNIPKNKAYQIYGTLELKGLIKSGSDGRQKRVVPAPLNALADQMKKQSRDFGKIAEDLKELGKFLPLLNKSTANASIKHLGHDEMKQAYMDILDEKFDYLLAYGGFDNFASCMGFDLEIAFINKRMKKGTFAKAALIGKGQYTNFLLDNDEDHMRKCAVTEDEYLQKQLGQMFVNVYPQTNKTIIWSRNSEGVLEATVIESPQVARVHEATFKHLNEMGGFPKSGK